MASDRANPASPWPDIRRESWLERLRRGVSTARAYPLHERGANQGPLGVAVNDLAASVPLPEDFSAMGDMAMRLMDPTGMYGNADAQGFDAAGALANPENLRAMMEYAGEHPVQTMASAFGGPAGIAAYRELAPQAARNYLHQFYGGGRPMHYVRSPLRAAATATTSSGDVALPPAAWGMENRNEALRAAQHVLESAQSRGTKPPAFLTSTRDVDPKFIAFHHEASKPLDNYRSYMNRSIPGYHQVAEDWNNAFGKSFVDPGHSRVWDWYQFYPEAYGSNNAGALLRRKLTELKEAWRMAPDDIGEPLDNPSLLDRVRSTWNQGILQGIAPRYLAMKFGTPYAIDASLTSGDALMEGLAPFSAIGATGEMLPPWMRSAAQPDAVRRER